MRLRQRDLRPFIVKKRILAKEPDGTTYETWEEIINPNPAWEAMTNVDSEKEQDGESSYEGERAAYSFWEYWLGSSVMGPVKPGEYDYVIFANIQPAGGRVMAEQYGERLGYMLVMYAERGAKISESDGVCVNVLPGDDPDYKVVSIRPWSNHLQIELEKVRM